MSIQFSADKTAGNMALANVEDNKGRIIYPIALMAFVDIKIEAITDCRQSKFSQQVIQNKKRRKSCPNY